MRTLVYIASPLSGDVEQNLGFARQACRYAIGQGVTLFAPHLLYTQMLDDGNPEDRQLGHRHGKPDAGAVSGAVAVRGPDQSRHGRRTEAGGRTGHPCSQICAEEIQQVDFSPTEGMVMG